MTRSTAIWISMGAVFLVLGWLLWSTLIPFGVSYLLAYILTPIVTRLERTGCPRWLTSYLLMAGLFSLVFVLLFVLVPFLERQFTLLLKFLPVYGECLVVRARPLFQMFQKYTDIGPMSPVIVSALNDILSATIRFFLKILTSGSALANILSYVFFVPLMTFYFLKDWPRVKESAFALIPPAQRPSIQAFLQDIDAALQNYARGQLLVCAILALYYMTMLSVIGLNFALLLGCLTGFLIFVPYLGFLTGLTFSLGIALSSFDSSSMALSVLAIYAVGQCLEGVFLTPRFVGGNTGLHPLWILFALFSSGALFGIGGVILCLPLAACARVVSLWGIKAWRRTTGYELPPL